VLLDVDLPVRQALHALHEHVGVFQQSACVCKTLSLCDADANFDSQTVVILPTAKQKISWAASTCAPALTLSRCHFSRL
jgi:hypothetical protein